MRIALFNHNEPPKLYVTYVPSPMSKSHFGCVFTVVLLYLWHVWQHSARGCISHMLALESVPNPIFISAPRFMKCVTLTRMMDFPFVALLSIQYPHTGDARVFKL